MMTTDNSSSRPASAGSGSGGDLSFEAHGEHWFALLRHLAVVPFKPKRESYRREATPLDAADASSISGSSADGDSDNDAAEEEWNFDELITEVHLQLDSADRKKYGTKLFDELYSFQKDISEEDCRRKFYVAGAKAWDVRNLVAAVIQKRDAVAVWIATKQGKMNGQEENTPRGTHARQISLGLHWFGLRNMFESVAPAGKTRPLNRDVYFDTHSQKWDFGGMIEDIYIHLDRREPTLVGETLMSELTRLHPNSSIADRSRFFSEAEGKWDIIALVRHVMPLRDPVTREQIIAQSAPKANGNSHAAAATATKSPPFASPSQDNPEAQTQTHNSVQSNLPKHPQTPPVMRRDHIQSAMSPSAAPVTPVAPPRYTGDLNKPVGGRSKSRSRHHSDCSDEPAATVVLENGERVPASPMSNNGGEYNSENHYKEEDQKVSASRPDLSDPRFQQDIAPSGTLPDCFSLDHLPRRSSPPSVRSRHSSRRSSLATSIIFQSGVTSPTTSEVPMSAQPPPVTGIHALASLMNESDIYASVNSKPSSVSVAAATRSRGVSRDSQATSDNSQVITPESQAARNPRDSKPPLSPPKPDQRRKRTPMPADNQMTWPEAASAEDFAQQQQDDASESSKQSVAATPKPPVTQSRSQGLLTTHPHHPHNVLARIRRKNTPSKRPSSAHVVGSRNPRNDSLPRYVGGVRKYGTLPGPLDMKTLSPVQGNPDITSVKSTRVPMGSRSERPGRVQKYGTLQSSLRRPLTRQARSGSKYGTSGPIDMSAMRRIHHHPHAQRGSSMSSMTSLLSSEPLERSRVLGLSERDLKQREFNAAQESAKLQRELEKLKRSNTLLQQQRTQYSSKLKQAEDRNNKLQNRLQDVVSQRGRRSHNKLNFKLIEPLQAHGLRPHDRGHGQTRGRSATPTHAANSSSSSSKRSSAVRESMRRGRSVGGGRKRKSLPALDLLLPPATTSFGANGVLGGGSPFSATPSDRDAVSVASKILETYEYQIKELKAENAKLRGGLSPVDPATPTSVRGSVSRSSSLGTSNSAADAETFLSSSKTHSRSSSMKSTPPGLTAVSSRMCSLAMANSTSAFESKESASTRRAETERNVELVESLRTELRFLKKDKHMASEIEKLLTEERNELLQTVDRLRSDIDKLKNSKRSVVTESGDSQRDSENAKQSGEGNTEAAAETDDLKSSDVAEASEEEQGDTTSENAVQQRKEVDIRDVKVENARHAITKLRTELEEVVADARATQVQLKSKLQGEAHSEERVLNARIECDAQKMRFNQLTKSYIDLQALLKSSERKVDALTKANLEIAKREADMDASLLELRERYGETLEELHEKARALAHATHERYRAVEELRAKTASFNELSERHEAYREMHENDDTGSVSSLELLSPSPFDAHGDENYAALTSEEILDQIREVRAKIAAARGDQVDLGALTHQQRPPHNDTHNSSGLSSAFNASFGHASQASSVAGDEEDQYGGVQLPPAVQLALLRQLEARIGRPLTDDEISHLRRLHAQLSQNDQGTGMTPEMIHQMVGALEASTSAEAAHVQQGADESKTSDRPTSAPPARNGHQGTPSARRRLSIPDRRRGACGGMTTTCGGRGRNRNAGGAPATRDDGYVGTTCSRDKCVVM